MLIISVAHTAGPYYLKSKGIETGTYIRSGSSNRMADRVAIAEIQRIATHQSFDELPNLQAKKEDLDFAVAQELFSHVGKKFNANTAESLGLLVRHQSSYYPTNGAILLFSKNRQRFFPDAIIRCGCFSETTKTHIIDQQDIDIALPLAADKVIAFIERNTSTAQKRLVSFGK